MNDKNTYSVDKYLEIIAEKEGITKEEVQQEIGRAVSIALKSPDPKMQLIIPELSEPPVRTLGATIPENESHIFR